MRIFLVLTMLIVAVVGMAARQEQEEARAPDDRTPGILFISLDDPDRPYVRDVVQGFQEALDAAGTPAVLYREFFDEIRFGDRPGYAAEFRDWLHRKYRDRRIDVIVVTIQSILGILAQAPDNPWNDVPIVYGTLGHLTIDISASHPTASGVVMENYLPRLLETIKTILPETHRIAAIQGSSAAERERDGWWLPQMQAHGLDVLSLDGLTIDELLERVAALPADTVPIVFSLQTDAAGRVFRPAQGSALVAAAANRPIFTLIGNDVPGMVGGPVPDFVLAGRELGAHALGRLAGEPPSIDEIPASRHSPLVFDARALERWHIPESRLPAGSAVQFRPPSLWRDYRGVVIAALTVGIVQMLLIVVVLVQRRHRARGQAALRESYTQLQHLTERLITAQEEERARIARDLHDDIGQRVASVSIGLSRLRREIADASSPMGESLTDLQQQASTLSTDLRQLSHDLHPGVLEHLGLLEALRARCDDFRAESGIDARLEVSDTWRDVPHAVALCLYRIAQEALRNVAAHADARSVIVSLDRQDGHTIMRVTDDGRGFETGAAARRAGLGLVSVAERIRMLGGTLDVVAAPGAGTTIVAGLPVVSTPR